MTPAIGLARALRDAGLDRVGARLGVAVSGGGDSMALMVLLADWARHSGAQIEAVTVDHGLRPGSADEAAQVAAAAANLGVAHRTLRWSGWDGSGNLQAAARAARYRLVSDWARARELGHVCLGHTQDDQAETVLLRLARGSGVDGLCAMAARRRQEGVTWLRPLLEVRRAALREVLRERDLGWIDDPSNEDPAFDRVRMRRVLAGGAGAGLSVPGLADTARRLRAARAVLARAAADAAERLARVEAGDIVLDRAGLFALPDETRWRLFAAALCRVSGAIYRPRLNALTRSLESLAAGRRVTLHGCLCWPTRGEIRVGRELAAVAARCAAPGLWDGRWQVRCAALAGLQIGALGDDGLDQRPDWRDSGLPRETLRASPALWRGATLESALLLDRLPDRQAELTWDKAEFVSFLLTD